jgi:hypothetical protein
VIVHLAGDQITMNNVSRQRCLWCGALICERDWAGIGIQIQPGETAEQAAENARKAVWSGFVAVDGGVTYSVPDDDPDKKPPAGSCLLLDIEVTR